MIEIYGDGAPINAPLVERETCRQF